VIGQHSAREGDVAVKIKTIGPRKAFYLAHIDLSSRMRSGASDDPP
jgi:hypothetical protein